MPEMPKGEEVLEIPENIEMEPETPGTEVKEIKPEEIEQEMKEIETEGGGITGTEILEGAERVLEGKRSEAAETVTEAEKAVDVGFETTEEVVELVNGGWVSERNGFKFSEMSEEEIEKLVNYYKEKAPISIPDESKITAKSIKDGYEQISYKWNDSIYKYEAR